MKKRLDRMLLCGLVVCSLTVPMGFADNDPTAEPSQEPAPSPTAASTPKPTEAPTSTPTPAATSEPTQTPAATAEPTQAPATTAEPTQTPAATAEPTQTPAATAEPTQTPAATAEPTQTPAATAEPTQTPATTAEPTQTPAVTTEPTQTPAVTAEPDVTPAPTATAHPIPDSIEDLVVITPEGTAKQEDDVWKITLSAPDSPLAFGWTVGAEAYGYLLYAMPEQGELYFISEASDVRIELPAANFSQGRYTLYVGAVLADGSVTWGKADFELVSGQSGAPEGGFPGGAFPGGRPGGSFGGSRPGGSFGGSASMSGMPEAAQGFRVTPGEPLTDSHASGTKDTTAYTYSGITGSGEAVTCLFLSSTQSGITLDDGAFFLVSEEDGALDLTPESIGSKWRLTVLAMNTLADSGIDRVVFHADGAALSVPTRMTFSGSVYASLRAQGLVSKDMELCIDEHGLRVHVAGNDYQINENGELLPCEE